MSVAVVLMRAALAVTSLWCFVATPHLAAQATAERLAPPTPQTTATVAGQCSVGTSADLTNGDIEIKSVADVPRLMDSLDGHVLRAHGPSVSSQRYLGDTDA